MSKLGEKVKELRIAQGMTVRRLAEKAGCGNALIHRVETGRGRYITDEQVKQLATGLGVSTTMLWDAIPENPKNVKYFRLVGPDGTPSE